MSGFRGLQSDLHRLAVPHLSDENHFGGLAQRRAQRERESRCVAMEFALVDGRLLMLVEKLDGVFNRQNVEGLFGVHHVNNRRKGRRLPRTRGPRD